MCVLVFSDLVDFVRILGSVSFVVLFNEGAFDS